MTTEETPAALVLKRAVAEFSRNRISAVAIRKLATDAPDLFASLSTEILLTGSDTAGHRFLALQLVKQPGSLDWLSDPWRFTTAQAITLARRLLKVDPTLDVRLARRLPGRNGAAAGDTFQGKVAERALDILDDISVGRRVVPLLNHLLDHPDKKISSRVALLVGKRVQNLAWAARVATAGEDPRTRANALESIWGCRNEGALELFRSSLRDTDNRVVGNAIVGLHLAGDPEIGNILTKFAEDFKPEFRMTAAWAMGRVSDPVFVPLLTPLIKDQHPGVRRAALVALHGIRTIERKQAKETEPEVPMPPATPPEEVIPEATEPPPIDLGFDLHLDGSSYASRR